jgi:hypothetical protein
MLKIFGPFSLDELVTLGQVDRRFERLAKDTHL